MYYIGNAQMTFQYYNQKEIVAPLFRERNRVITWLFLHKCAAIRHALLYNHTHIFKWPYRMILARHQLHI